MPTVSSCITLKTLENQRYSDVFRGYKQKLVRNRTFTQVLFSECYEMNNYSEQLFHRALWIMAVSEINRMVQDLENEKMHLPKWKFEARLNFQILDQAIRMYFNYWKKSTTPIGLSPPKKVGFISVSMKAP